VGKLTIACCLCLLSMVLSACQQKYYVSISDASDPAHPVFCISSWPRCLGSVVSPNAILVLRVGNEPAPERVVWLVQSMNAARRYKRVVYGFAPEGWTTRKAPIPLKAGKFYQLDLFYFSCSGVAPHGTCETCGPDRLDQEAGRCLVK
jgi:hypothetical protein